MMIIPKLSSGCLLSAVLIQLMVSEEGDDHLIHNWLQTDTTDATETYLQMLKASW